jgi:multidrug efflux pump subunit AcrA (membrane-fusion protein)
MKNNLKAIVLPVRKRIITTYRKVPSFIEKSPLVAFFLTLGALLVLIVISSFLRKPAPPAPEPKPAVKVVKVYRIGESPKIRVQAQIEKSGVIQVNSLAAGVVQRLPFKPGDHVSRGDVLAALSTNYQGGNALSTQSQIAATQYQNIVNTLPTQKDLIAKQKDLASKQDENSDDLRDITSQSLDETQSLINLNSDILNTLDRNLNQYEATNSAGMNDQAILSTKQLKSQFQSANNQLNSQLRTNQYQAAADKPPAEISDLQRDIAIKQLELQEKTLDLNAEISRLQLQLARINEGIMFPASPFAGTVQRIFVKVGQAVNPGTPLAIIAQSAEDDPIVAVAYVSRQIAQNVSPLEPSILYMGETTYDTYPSYITQDAIQGTLYGIYFPVPDNYSRFTTEKGFIYVDLPIGVYDTGSTIPYIPIDAVYQTQDSSYIFVIENGKVVSKKVLLGDVYGSYVQVTSGLGRGDMVILDRNVVAGDLVKAQN